MKTTSKQFKYYIIFAFGLAWILQVLASKFAKDGNILIYQFLLLATMFMPLLATLLSRISLKGMGWKISRKDIKYILFALWSPALLSLLGAGLFFLLFPYSFDSGFETLTAVIGEVGIKQMESQGITIPIYILISSIQAVTYAPFINMISALGEEVGWRGAMYPYLKDKLGVNKGRIVGGSLWGLWHFPIMILAGYNYGTDYIGYPILGPIIFCVFCIVIGIILDYIYEKSKSIWLPSLMHGAINAFTIFAYLIKPEYKQLIVLGPAYIGIIGMIPSIILSIIITKKIPKEV